MVSLGLKERESKRRSPVGKSLRDLQESRTPQSFEPTPSVFAYALFCLRLVERSWAFFALVHPALVKIAISQRWSKIKFSEPSPTPQLAFPQLPSPLEFAPPKTTWGVAEFYYLKSLNERFKLRPGRSGANKKRNDNLDKRTLNG
jgi:hypothetical protein